LRRIFAVCAVAWACGRSQSVTDRYDETSTPASGASSGQSAASSVAHVADAAPSSSSAMAPTGADDHWHGTYKSASGELYIPPDWKNVRWNVKETPSGIGEGAMTLSVDPSSGRALGSLDGPLGPGIVDGLLSEGKLTAIVARKDPADQGFTGTLVGSMSGDHAEGTMSLSLAEASAVRRATFALSRAGQAAAR
jgi:hypothetical protein